MIDRDIHLARALLVEGNPLLRSVAAEQLRGVGVGHVAIASKPRDARLLIEREAFDIIVCNRDFEDCSDSGQDLLDELRRENQLPHSTVFLMVVAEASYAKVVEAAEASLDGILVRPYTGALLAQRLMEARNRKRELADVLRALEAGQNDVALARAARRFQEGGAYATWCGRLVAELLLAQQRPEDARKVFEKLSQGGQPWARLGVARALIAGGELAPARRVLQALLDDDPASADAHDLLGRILVEQCDFDGALAEYREAAELTPGCLLRTQHAGALAFYQGRAEEALGFLERAVGLGVPSKLFDALTLLLMAVLRHDRGETPGVVSMRDQLVRYQQRFPDSRRLQRLVAAAEVLVALMQKGAAAAIERLRVLTAEAGDPGFDLEGANLLLMLWARVPAAQRAPAEHEAVLERLAMRFCASKALGEVLLASARRSDEAQAVIRRCQARVAGLVERAMDQALHGEPEAAVRTLLEQGEQTLNPRLIEMAGILVRRHASALGDADALAGQAAALQARQGPATTHIAGIQRSGRSPGGLQLRGRNPGTVHVAAA